MIKKIIVISIIFGVLLPSFSFSQIKPPETLEEAKEMGERVGREIQTKLPDTLEKIWKEEVLPVWQKIYQWLKANVWLKIESLFKKEAEKRKPLIEEEFKKEKKELKEELPGVTKSLWEKFKELIK